MALHLVVYLVCQTQTLVVHRQQETLNLQLRVQTFLHNLDGAQQLRDTLQCKIFTLHGDDDAVGGCQRIHRDEAQRGRTVYQDVVVLLAYRLQCFLDDVLTVFHVQHLNLGTYQVNMAGDDVQSFNIGCIDSVTHVRLVDNALIE